ncbi:MULTISPECIES: peptidoglycan-binding domain-containing protein [unclassified Microbacterium]|uniref:peptidoglycan-binding domain-containing protein n=2 Tax=Microbacterium TaxID=33882 RepID=UPI00344A98CC
MALVCVGFGVGYMVAPSPVPGSLASDTGASDVAVTPLTFDDPRQVTLIPSAGVATSLTVNRAGVVTETRCTPGTKVSSGEIAVAVDGQPIPYLALRVPLWRDLAVGDKGDDVKSLQESLGALGFDVSADGEYGQATARAISAFKQRAGLADKADGIRRGDIVWIPASSVTVATCTAQLGQEITAPGEIAQTEVGLVSVAIDGLDRQAAPGPRTLVFESAAVPLNDANLDATDPQLLAAIQSSPQYSAWKSTEGEVKITAQASLAEPISAYVVPPSALIGSGARACVISSEGPQPVNVLSSTLGRVVIQTEKTISSVKAPVPADQVCP